MKRSERELVRDALAEAVAEYADDPNEDRRHVLNGMRYVAGLLGMPEGRSDFQWPAGTPIDRAARRRILLRYRRGAS